MANNFTNNDAFSPGSDSGFKAGDSDTFAMARQHSLGDLQNVLYGETSNTNGLEGFPNGADLLADLRGEERNPREGRRDQEEKHEHQEPERVVRPPAPPLTDDEIRLRILKILSRGLRQLVETQQN